MQLQQLILFHLGDSLSGQLQLVDDQTPRLRRGAPLVEKHEERIRVDGRSHGNERHVGDPNSNEALGTVSRPI